MAIVTSKTTQKNVQILLHRASLPMIYVNVVNTYTKDDLFCVMQVCDGKRVVHKYPIGDIFRIEEVDE